MEVSFSHSNLRHGNESTLLRFTDSSFDAPQVLLIDAGEGTEVESHLNPDDELVGILLTHAHQDHYVSLGHIVRDNIPVFAAPGTADILETVLTELQRYLKTKQGDGEFMEFVAEKRGQEEVGDIDLVLDNLRSIDSWEFLNEALRIHPIPAGHAPGAAGFLIQFEDGGDWHTIVETGDFTLSRSAGYPEFPTDLLVNVEALLLTGSTSEVDERGEIFRVAIEQAVSGSRVLLTATGLTCVEFAYLLGHLIDQQKVSVPVTITGQAAKLYDKLGYSVPGVTSLQEFDSTKEVLQNGGIALSGPQVPTEGASGRLFDSIRESGAATLIQATDGGHTPIQSAGCTVHHHRYIPHPTESEVDTVVNSFQPSSVVVTHQTGGGMARYRDKYKSYVWATNDEDWNTIYGSEQWASPPWMTRAGREHVQSGRSQPMQNQIVGNLPLPSLDRYDTVDFDAEGLNLSKFALFHRDVVL